MPTKPTRTIRTRLSSRRIALIYLAVGVVWILATGIWVRSHSSASHDAFTFELIKGIAFVGGTALLLWFLCRKWSSEVEDAVEQLQQSQSNYEIFVKSAPVSITLINRDGTIAEANEATRDLTGYPLEELGRMNIFQLDDVDDIAATREIFDRIFSDGVASSDRRIRRKDGTIAYTRIDGVRFGEDQALCFSRDITDRRNSERKLLMLNAMLRAIRRVNQAIVHEAETPKLIRKICDILVEDREFKHAWIVLLGPDGKPVNYADSPELDHAQKLRAFLDEGRLTDCLTPVRREDGLIIARNPREDCPDFPLMPELEGCALLGRHFTYDSCHGYIALMAIPEVADDEDELALFAEVADDLKFALHTISMSHEKASAIENLVKAKREAENANRAKDEFLAMMSHEMRTPLNPIMGHCALLSEDLGDPDQLESLEQINRSSEHLLHLIEDILFFSQLQQGDLPHGSEDFDLLESCRGAIDATRRDYPETQIVFNNGIEYLDPIAPGTRVRGDSDLFQRVLLELLGNACKYSSDAPVKVRIGGKPKDDEELEVTLQVIDLGIGIPAGLLENLFDPFVQADSSHTRKYEGAGLGLAICKKICDSLGATIFVDSQPGIGSNFTVQYAFARADEPVREERSPSVASPPQAGDHMPRILVVEDKESNARVAQVILERWKYETAFAAHGREAVEKCANERFDLILMDLSMPVMNGFEATREIIGANGPNRKTPIIGLSAHVSQEVENRCLDSGMRGFVPKPIRIKDLKSVIGRYLPQP